MTEHEFNAAMAGAQLQIPFIPGGSESPDESKGAVTEIWVLVLYKVCVGNCINTWCSIKIHIRDQVYNFDTEK